MSEEFSGRILDAAGSAPVGLQVHIFEKDGDQIDDDLTISPGEADAEGRFQVQFISPGSAYFNVAGLFSPLSAPFDWSDPSSQSITRRGPYLQFHYMFNGQPRTRLAPLVPFQREFRLPELTPVQFKPSVQGFQFDNLFKGYPLPDSIPIPSLPGKVDPTYGLCGGMSSAAYDFVLANRSIPADTKAPVLRSSLHRYLYQRQIDSFGPLGKSVVQVGEWTIHPDEGPGGLQNRTFDEFQHIRTRLDDQNLVVLALIYKKANSLVDMMQVIWKNHQVLACGYMEEPGGDVEIQVYDPNCHGRDDSIIQAKRVEISSGVYGYQCMHVGGGYDPRPVHGFFAMTYTRVIPPVGL